MLEYILFFLAIRNELKDKKHAFLIFACITLSLLFICIDEIWQLVTGADFIRGYGPIINLGLYRATASFKDANNLGIYLSGLSPILFGVTFYYFKGRHRQLPVFISLVCFIGLILTYSRPTLLAVLLILFFFAVAKRNKIFIAVLLMLVFISPFAAPKVVKQWAKSVDYNPVRFMCNDDRIAVYLNTVNMIKAHPITGVGAGAFMKSYKFYKSRPEYMNIVTLDEMKAHNNFLHMAAEVGLVGLGIFFWFLFSLFRQAIAIYRGLSDDFLKIFSLSLMASILAFLINGLTESSLYYSRVAPIFWYVSSLSLALNKFRYVDKTRSS